MLPSQTVEEIINKFIDNPVGKNFIREVVPAGRLGEPEEIGELINYRPI